MLGPLAEGEARLEGGAFAAAVIAFATVGDGNALALGLAPRGGQVVAEAGTAIVVVVGAGDGDLRAAEVGGDHGVATPGERGQQAEAVAAQVVEVAADRDVDARVGLRAQRLAGAAELDTTGVVFVEDVVGETVTALVALAEVVGLVVVGAAVDGGQAFLVVVGGEIARLALQADFIDVVNVLAVLNNSDAVETLGADEVPVRADLADELVRGDGGGGVGHAVLDLRQTALAVGGQDEAVVAEPAAVLGAEVDLAVVDGGQALVALAAEPGEGVLAEDAEAHAVILDAVGDGSGNARAPVGGLGEAVGALGADVGGRDVKVAVVDALEAAVLNENVGAGTALADGGRGLLAVGETARDVRHERAGLPGFQVEALLALDAAAQEVDGLAAVVPRLHARSGLVIKEVIRVALGAVQVVHVLQAPRDVNRLGIGGLDSSEAEGEGDCNDDRFVHVTM